MKLRQNDRDLRFRDKFRIAFRPKLTDPIPMWAIFGSLALSASAIIGGPFTEGFWQNILSNIALVGPGLFFTNVVARYWREKRLLDELSPRISQICGVIYIEYVSPALAFASGQADLCGIQAEAETDRARDAVAISELRDKSASAAITYIVDRINEIEDLLLSTLPEKPEAIVKLSMWHIYHMPPLLDAYLESLSRHMHTAQARTCFEAVAEALHNRDIPTVSGESSDRVSAIELFRTLGDTRHAIDEIGVAYGQLVMSIISIGMHLRNGLNNLHQEIPGFSKS